jgi:hypothetical protein
MSYWPRIPGVEGRIDAISFQGLPLVFELRRTWLVLLLLAGLGALAGCEDDGSRAPASEDASAEIPRARREGSAQLLAVDLSDEAAAGMSREELWALGASLLGWPEEAPPEITKEEVHGRLLEAKYRYIGDFGYGEGLPPR